MKAINVQVKCAGQRHTVRLMENGTITMPNHHGPEHEPAVYDNAVTAMHVMGGEVRCAEVKQDFEAVQKFKTARGHKARVAAAINKRAPTRVTLAFHRLPAALQKAALTSFETSYKATGSPARALHAKAKVKELDRRIKTLQTKRKKWVAQVKRYAKKGL